MIVVVPRQRLEIADLRGDTAEILNMHKTAAAPPRIGPLAKSAEGSPWRRRMIRRLSWGSFTCNVVMVVLSWKHKKYESVSVELTGSFGKFVNIRDMWRCHWYPMAVLLRCSCGNEVSTEVRARRYCSHILYYKSFGFLLPFQCLKSLQTLQSNWKVNGIAAIFQKISGRFKKHLLILIFCRHAKQ